MEKLSCRSSRAQERTRADQQQWVSQLSSAGAYRFPRVKHRPSEALQRDGGNVPKTCTAHESSAKITHLLCQRFLYVDTADPLESLVKGLAPSQALCFTGILSNFNLLGRHLGETCNPHISCP